MSLGPNAPCPCGSGKKLKHCCGRAMAWETSRVEPVDPRRLASLKQTAADLFESGRFPEAMRPLAELARLQPGRA